jgi:ABC-type nickel/cobalt efflux system permease component RcnA
MDLDSGALAALTLGLLLGLKHATDADHVVAVSTIVGEYRNAWRGIWVGASWGLGHTTPLLVLGIIILLFKGPVMDRYETAAPVMEFGVGAMLVLLGAQVMWNLRRRRLHVHEHVESDGSHVHIHATHGPEKGPDAAGRPHGFFHFGRPFFRVKSFTVGIVHGLAGSAAVMLVLLPTLSSVWVGVGYLILFGVGTIISMSAITLALGVPFAATGGSQRLNNAVAITAGVASSVLGVALMSDTMFGTSLLPI